MGPVLAQYDGSYSSVSAFGQALGNHSRGRGLVRSFVEVQARIAPGPWRGGGGVQREGHAWNPAAGILGTAIPDHTQPCVPFCFSSVCLLLSSLQRVREHAKRLPVSAEPLLGDMMLLCATVHELPRARDSLAGSSERSRVCICEVLCSTAHTPRTFLSWLASVRLLPPRPADGWRGSERGCDLQELQLSCMGLSHRAARAFRRNLSVWPRAAFVNRVGGTERILPRQKFEGGGRHS